MSALRRSLQGLALGAGLLGGLVYLRARQEPAPEPAASSEVRVPVAVDVVDEGRRPMRAHDAAFAPGDAERRRIVLLNNEAAEHLLEGRLERAVELFETCHGAYPEDDVFTRNLAEALARLARRHHDERRLGLAVAELARVLELAPDREDAASLREVLARWRKEAELAGAETTDTSRYFELTYDASREDVLHRSGEVLAALELAYGALRDWFQVDPVVDEGSDPIRVVLYAPRTFDELTGLGDWAGGSFDGTVRISVADLEREAERWRRIARHELAHAFLRHVGGTGVPGWLNEGLAQWLEGGARHARTARARELLSGAELFPLARLQGSLASWEDTRAIERAYAQSLVLVDHIAQNYGELVLLRMVTACRGGGDPAGAFEAQTSVPLSFVLADLPNYLR